MQIILELPIEEVKLIEKVIQQKQNEYQFNQNFINIKSAFFNQKIQYNIYKERLIKLDNKDARLLEAIILDIQPQIGLGSDNQKYNRIANNIDDQANIAEQNYLDQERIY